MTKTEYMLDLGITAYNNHLFAVAAERLRQAVEWNPEDWNAWHFLAMSHLRNHNFIKAREAYEHIRDYCQDPGLLKEAEDALLFIEHQNSRPH